MKILPYFPIKLISETKIHGGKHYTCRRILSLAPQEFVYEPGKWGYGDLYLGAGSMTYNAPAGLRRQACSETNWFRYITKLVIRDYAKELLKSLSDKSYTEGTFEAAKGEDEIDQAALKASCLRTNNKDAQIRAATNYIIRNRMSRGGLGKSFAWSDRLRGGQPGDQNAWQTMFARLPDLSRRLKDVDICNIQALQLLKIIVDISRQTAKPWFTYLDPPYPKTTRSTKAVEYGDDEMTIEQHKEMLNAVTALPRFGHIHVAISSYHNPLYDEMLKNWRIKEIDMPNHSSQSATKERRTEVLYMNYDTGDRVVIPSRSFTIQPDDNHVQT